MKMKPKKIPGIECRACRSHILEPHITSIASWKEKTGKTITTYFIDFWYCPFKDCGTVYYFPEMDKIVEES